MSDRSRYRANQAVSTKVVSSKMFVGIVELLSYVVRVSCQSGLVISATCSGRLRV